MKYTLISKRKNLFLTNSFGHEGELLSLEEDYETAHTKLKVKCKNNHEFDITWNDKS